MFHTCAHIYNLVLVQNLSLNSNLVCTFHLIVQFYLPILFLVLFVRHTCQEHEMIAGCSVARGDQSFVAVSGAGGAESFDGTSLVDYAYYHPRSLYALLHFCKWGNEVHMSIFLWPA